MSDSRFHPYSEDLERFQIKENLAKTRFYVKFEQETMESGRRVTHA